MDDTVEPGYRRQLRLWNVVRLKGLSAVITFANTPTEMNDDWSRQQVEAAVADYLAMLALELRGEDYNKAERNRRLQALIGRSRGSIERKHQNISSVMIEQGFPYVSGYKPLGHAQKMLREVVIQSVTLAVDVHQQLDSLVDDRHIRPPAIADILSIEVPPPSRPRDFQAAEDPPPLPTMPRRAVRRNYLQEEARNRAIGLAGEELALRYEYERLWHAGKKNLAERIDHVSRSRGDGLGYDILSFEITGKERLIEVKTTNFGPLTPFYVSRGELGFSGTADISYALYRLFNFHRQPRLFVLPGPLEGSCEIEPIQYSAIPGARHQN